MMAPAQKAQTTDKPNYQGRSQTVNKQIKENECTNLPRQITSKHVSEGITLAMKGTQENKDNPVLLSNETWETQARKSRNKGRVKNKPIVGNKTKCSLKAATQKMFLHVYKLDVSMKPQDVSDFLKPSFPEVDVEQLLSRYPQFYSSFKVTINEINYEKAMDSSVWPDGALVNRFLHRRTKTNNNG
ncbi:hypothetical protein JTB14_029186 [Gonioctena quinquepunctata]|nr:hypothetical protein JTB14_029186 [Gonioctena quinquepunctata]